MNTLPARRSWVRAVLAAVVLFGYPGRATAQDAGASPFPEALCSHVLPASVAPLASGLDELGRLAEISGAATPTPRMIRRLSAPIPADSTPSCGRDLPALFRFHGARLVALPAFEQTVSHSAFPDDRNNGLLWAGRGLSTQLRAGVAFHWRAFSAALAPEAAWQQNRAFQLVTVHRAGYSPYVDPWYTGIDYPQRFGDRPFTATGWGQSYVRVDARGMAAGFSSQNMWWGPAQRYPILMSNTAPGFPHAFLGTSHPADIWIGRVQAELLVGRTTESSYFDNNPANDHNRLAALVLAFSPRPLPGLWLGAARVHQYFGRRRSIGDTWEAIKALSGTGSTNLPGNELGSIFFRWVFPRSAAEVYGEWARDDRWGNWQDLVEEPDHSQAYMLGLQKLTALGPDLSLRVHAELVALQEKSELTRVGSRPLSVYYTHSQILQGYTNGGQILGAGVGPGADAQFLGVDVLRPWGMAGTFVERVRRNDASRAAIDARRNWPYLHDTELIGGLRGTYFPPVDGLSVSGRLSFSHRLNWQFHGDAHNTTLELEVTWLPTVEGQP